MNDKTEYQNMLEMPVNTCSITHKPVKKKRQPKAKNVDEVKKQLLDKVNSEEPKAEQTSSVKIEKKFSPKGFKFNAVACELVIIGVLIAVICLTNVFNKNSAMNVFFKDVFGNGKETIVSSKIYSDFSPVLSLDGFTATGNDGVFTLNGEGSVYSPVNGKVEKCEVDENGKYSLTVFISDNFKTVISGLEYAYAEEGMKVLTNVPVGYVKDNCTLCFYGENDQIITSCSLLGNSVVWEV